MSRFIIVPLLAALSLFWRGSAAESPNIIFILADDLGYAELGSYGQEKIKTPNLDRMAREGMRFTNHYTGSPVCGPARCSLMTGKHGGRAFIRDNHEVGTWESHDGQLPLPADEVTLAEILKAQGYATGAFGKWGLGGVGSTGDPLRQGFDRFFGYNCQRHAHNLYPRYLIDDTERRPLPGNTRGVSGETYAPQVIADEMLKFIKQGKDKPFFVYYPTIIPHLALQVPEEELASYLGQWPETPYTGKSYQPHPTPKAAYAGMVSFMDKQVGRIFDLLEELGIDDNTIVFFTSDNGTTHLKQQVDYEFFNSVDGLRGLKGSVYEGGIRVPLLVRWPGHIKPGSTSHHISAHYDTLATIAALTGAPVPPGTTGISYLPTLLAQGSQLEHEYLFWDFAGYGGQLAVRSGDWKAVRRDLKKTPDAPLQLYNLREDRGENTNVAQDHPEVAGRMRTIMREARTRPSVERFRFGEYP